jgi:hypothetical protein
MPQGAINVGQIGRGRKAPIEQQTFGSEMIERWSGIRRVAVRSKRRSAKSIDDNY